ncbi:MAG: DUF86 domain-containing protein [Planctomycetes bacterium]|nr:DUF86 domain-containing protein [Planctomycetota bacterium]
MAISDKAIRHRLELLEGYVQGLRALRGRTLEEVQKDVSVAWAVQHGLQISIQCVIDICQQLVAALALGSPSSSIEAVDLLRDAGIFPAALAQTLVQMARFRNVLVHAYAQVDLRRVHANLVNHVDDFGRFAQHILAFLARQAGGSP